jgi:phosphonate transport system permease protein
MSQLKPNIAEQLKNEPKYTGRVIVFLVSLAALLYGSSTYINYQGLTSRGLDIARNIVVSVFTPNTAFLFDFSTRGGVPYLLLETAAIAFLGTIIGTILSIPIAFLSSRNIVPKFIASIGVALITVIRTFPAVVYGLMFIRVTGPGPFTGVLTLAIASVGMVSKLFIEVIEDLDPGIIEALDASGCNMIQKVQYGIIPQLLSNFLSTAIYRFEINIKYATILGMVGAGGIGAPLIFAINAYRWNDAGALLIGLIVSVLVVELISTRLRKKLATGD